MVLQKQEEELKNRVLKLAKRNYQGLGTFIRLVDYMVVETQVKINQESADLILAEMTKDQKKQPRYSISTTLDFDAAGEQMAFEPAREEFTAAFDKLLQDMQSVTEEVLRVISHGEFRQFIHGLISDSGPRFRTIVEGSVAYRESKKAIRERLLKDFELLEGEVKSCLECKDINKFDHEFDFDKFKAEDPPPELDRIRPKLDDFSKWLDLIGQNIKRYESGLVHASAQKLRGRLVTKVKAE
jgi:hypothetical protein